MITERPDRGPPETQEVTGLMATEVLTAAALRKMTPEQIREKLDALPVLALLRELPDEVVLALPTEVLEWRRDKLLASRKPLTGRQAWPVVGVGDKHFQRLRTNYLATGVESFDALPAPDEDLSDDDIRRPGDDSTSRKSGSPRWRLGDLVRWTIERERVDEDRNGPLTLILRPGGRKPPGRTPGVIPVQRARRGCLTCQSVRRNQRNEINSRPCTDPWHGPTMVSAAA